MACTNLRQCLDAMKATERDIIIRKVPSQVTVAGNWFDLNMSPGNPKPFYYASPPLEAVALTTSDGGIQHGGLVTPSQKYLKRALMMSGSSTGLPMSMISCDYLMYYPFCDMGETEAQPLVNDVTLPRHTDGEGVRIMAVLVAAGAGGQTFQCSYTNSDGVAGRLTTVTIMNTSTAIGNLVSSQRTNASASGPFLPLQGDDTGVRSIESVQMISGADVGLFTLVLVKPLAQMQIIEQTAPCEIDYARDAQGFYPVIEDGAYLNYICCPNGSLSGVVLIGEMTFFWG